MKRLADHILTVVFAVLAAAVLAVGSAAAQDLPAGQPVPDTPVEVKAGSTPVGVIHDQVDQLGTRLAFQLKETFNASSLFSLTSADEPKIKLIVSTQPEFPSRPQLGSVYSVVWIFSASENVLTHYLASEAGTVDAATVAAAAEALAGRTTAVAEQYAYLFE